MTGAGVHVTTISRSGPTSASAPLEAQAFMAGVAVSGLARTAQLCRSYADFVAAHGQPMGAGAYLSTADVVRSFFEEGGQRLWFSRVVGPDAEVATRTLMDGAGSPLATIKIDATTVGAWANAITVAVTAGTTTTKTLTFAGLPDDLGPVVLANQPTVAAVVNAINGHPRLSRYLEATNLGSATAAPTNLPALLAAAHLAGGDDDAPGVTVEGVQGIVADFPADLGPGVMITGAPPAATPADEIAEVFEAIRDTYVAEGRTIGTEGRLILFGASGEDSTAEQITLAQAFRAGAAQVDGAADWLSFCGYVPGTVTIPGGNEIPATGWVAAARTRAMITDGPWRAPAGEISQARWVTGIVDPPTANDVDLLTEAGVIPLRNIGGGLRIYGWRSLSADLENWALLTSADTAGWVGYRCALALEELEFGTIDSARRLLSRMEAKLVGVVEPIRAVGGLFEKLAENGSRIDAGYKVDVGEVVNPLEALAANRLGGVVAIRVSPTAQLIELTIVKASLAATL